MLLFVLLAVASAQSSCGACDFGMCNNCPNCPVVVASGPDVCGQRAQSSVLFRSALCPSRSRVYVNFALLDQPSDTAGIPSFDLFFFNSDAALQQFRECNAVASASTYSFKSCVNALLPGSKTMGSMSSSNVSVAVVVCLRDMGCSLQFRFAASCWGLDSVALGAAGVAVGGATLLLWILSALRTGCRAGTPLRLAGVATALGLMLAFWGLMIADGSLGTSPDSLQMSLRVQGAMSWLEKLILLVSVWVMLLFLFPVMAAVHEGRDTLRIVLLCVGAVAGAVFVGLMVPFHLGATGALAFDLNLLLAWSGVSFGLMLLAAALLLLYSVLAARSAESKCRAVSLIVLFAVVAAVNVMRIIVAAVSYFGYRDALVSGAESSWLYYSFSPFSFNGDSGAISFALVVMLLPQFVPLIVFLIVLLLPNDDDSNANPTDSVPLVDK